MVEPRIESATAAHARELWRALAWAAHMPGDGSEGDVLVARETPALSLYVEGFGRASDVGVLARGEDGAFVGAAWWRLIRGYGFLDERTPELCVGVAPGVRGQGLGGRLLSALWVVAPGVRVCLNVREDNPAVCLYERHGFVRVHGSEMVNRVGGVSFNMVREVRSG